MAKENNKHNAGVLHLIVCDLIQRLGDAKFEDLKNIKTLCEMMVNLISIF